jgi:hypothetical protein
MVHPAPSIKKAQHPISINSHFMPLSENRLAFSARLPAFVCIIALLCLPPQQVRTALKNNIYKGSSAAALRHVRRPANSLI